MEVLNQLSRERHVCGLADFEGSCATMISFKAVEKHLGDVLEDLHGIGVGVNFGSIDIWALQSTKPIMASYGSQAGGPKRRNYRVHDRMTVEEIFASVDEQSHLTFDYLCNTFVAALISAVGLLTDSSVTVVASMLVSPLMGCILAITFGWLIRDRVMVQRGLRNEAWGVAICLLVGALVGLATSPFFGPGGVQRSWANNALRSNEIESRGVPVALLSGFFVAVPSGMGVALGITGGGINALVGVAISAALLPPIVNTGLCLAFSGWYFAYNHAEGAAEESHRFLRISLYSFALFMVNLVVIFLMAAAMFKLKRVTMPRPLSSEWRPLPTRATTMSPAPSERSNYDTMAASQGPTTALGFMLSLFHRDQPLQQKRLRMQRRFTTTAASRRLKRGSTDLASYRTRLRLGGGGMAGGGADVEEGSDGIRRPLLVGGAGLSDLTVGVNPGAGMGTSLEVGDIEAGHARSAHSARSGSGLHATPTMRASTPLGAADTPLDTQSISGSAQAQAAPRPPGRSTVSEGDEEYYTLSADQGGAQEAFRAHSSSMDAKDGSDEDSDGGSPAPAVAVRGQGRGGTRAAHPSMAAAAAARGYGTEEPTPPLASAPGVSHGLPSRLRLS